MNAVDKEVLAVVVRAYLVSDPRADHPTTKVIAARLSLSESKVRAALARLDDDGMVDLVSASVPVRESNYRSVRRYRDVRAYKPSRRALQAAFREETR